MRVDLISVWKNQKISEGFVKNVHFIAPIVANTIKDICDEFGYIPREVAKAQKKANGKKLWTILTEKKIKLIDDSLINNNQGSIDTPEQGTLSNITEEQQKALTQLESYTSEQLWSLARWARETDNLRPYQRGILGSVAQRIGGGRKPTAAQAVQVLVALDEAKNLGFSFNF